MISVIIPTYNREKTIERAIKSVLNQSIKDIELIVVDDCSTDSTSLIMKRYQDNNKIKYIKLKQNSGACFARNTGIKEAKGEYIAFQDSDDEWLENKLELQLDNLKKENSDVDFCLIKKYFSKDNSYFVFPDKKRLSRIRKYGMSKAFCLGNLTSTQAIFGKAEVFKNNLFDEKLPRLQEYDLMLRLSKKYKFSITKQELVNVYLMNDSISKNEIKLIKAFEIIEKKNYSFDENEKKTLLSYIYLNYGNYYSKNNKSEARKYYIRSLKNRFDLKNLIKHMKYII